MVHNIYYYNSQISSPHQRGSGIGSFFGGLFRSILPIFTRGAKAVSKEAWRTGINILSDFAHPCT